MKGANHKAINSRVFGLTLLFFAVIFLCVKSVSTVLASLNFYGANNYIEQWEAGGNITNEGLIKANLYATNALKRHSTHPLYSDTLSTVLQYRALNSDDNQTAVKLLDSAEQLNWKSIAQRPAWPVTWANLAYIKWLKGEVDSELSQYMATSSALGANTPEVHITIVNIGLSMSKRNVREFLKNKELIKKHTLLGLRHRKSRSSIIDIATNTKTQAMVCTWIKQSEAVLRNPLRCA